ncbi:sodium/glutamate symporter [Aminiphilus sp.]|jgi:ESS family glutamate:Na+ symporter|uniref:sodium/glutamate symporter n=1 Tax=Aminiphilus sp. TaxID=1872488 RepID=UPI00262AD07C|nr:sodium/glutamate symporter [Aminiphilus sp.]
MTCVDFSPWVLFVDLGIASGLILLGQLIRAKVRFVQELFLPASLLAGFLGLAFGPNGLGYLPFSGNIGVYPGILITLVFGALPLASEKAPFREIFDRVGNLWAYSQVGMILQWGIGALFGMFILGGVWKDLNPAFGLMLASGFAGGHGTAAAIGAAFKGLGWEDAGTLAMTSATVGVVSAVVGGLILAKWGSRKGYSHFLTTFDDMPTELKTGLIPPDRRHPGGFDTVSSISIDPVAFHLALIFLASLGGYYLSKLAGAYIPKVSLPVFSCAFVVGIVMNHVLQGTGASTYVDKKTMGRLSGTFTDLLVAFGIASIKLPVVIKYALPLACLFVFGIVYCLFVFSWLTPRIIRSYWFEKGLFTWGWMTGTMAMGIALLRIVDPELKSKALDDFAFAYLPIAPVEILVVSFSPVLFVEGKGLYFIGACVAYGLAVWLFAAAKGWFHLKPNEKKVTLERLS